MLMSMTGFGRASTEVNGKKITVEIKSLNSKQMDLSARIAHQFRAHEIRLRNYLSSILNRGKTDLIVSIELSKGAETSTTLNLEILEAYKNQIKEASKSLSIPEPEDWFPLLLRLPDSLSGEIAEEASDAEIEALDKAAENAVKALMDYRREEGLKLEHFFEERIRGIADLLSEVEPYESQRIERIRARLEENLSKIPVAEYDKGRLEQEMIFYLEKLDVNEEKQRLAQHLKYFVETMALPEPGQGKKLGFIAQEMGREINTLGSKSNHAEMQKIVVKMKDLLEQIKEQVLNVL